MEMHSPRIRSPDPGSHGVVQALRKENEVTIFLYFAEFTFPTFAILLVLYVLQLAYHAFPRIRNHRARQKRRAL